MRPLLALLPECLFCAISRCATPRCRPRLKEHFTPFEHSESAFFASSSDPALATATATVAPASSNPRGLAAYWKLKNAESVDGLPGLEAAGFPPEEGAIRKARRRGEKVAYGLREVEREREGRRWVEVALGAGLVLGWWLGSGGGERVRDEVGALVQQGAAAIASLR